MKDDFLVTPNTLDIRTALSRIDAWSREARPVKVVVIGPFAQTHSGWGGVQTDGERLLRVVYRRDSDGEEVDQVFDVSAAAASESSIWAAARDHQEKYGHFDESMGFAFSDGRVLLLMCATGAAEN